MKAELLAANRVLEGRCQTVSTDFVSLFVAAKHGDFFYLDPPYQGTSEGRDQRYISGVSRDRMIESLKILNEKKIPFILSYDGSCGDKDYGDPLPNTIARRILLDVGRSSQATLNGRNDVTVESLYVSDLILGDIREVTLSLKDFAPQAMLFG
jgi:DNA adenine methylase